MSKMRIEELKDKILEQIKEQKLDTEPTKASDITYRISGIVTKLINGYERLYTTEENGNVYIRSWDGGKWFDIKIAVKKKKIGIDYKDWNYGTNYIVKDIEVANEYVSIEEFIEKVREYKENCNKYYQDKKNELLSSLEKVNLTFKDFIELINTYESLDYTTKCELRGE